MSQMYNQNIVSMILHNKNICGRVFITLLIAVSILAKKSAIAKNKTGQTITVPLGAHHTFNLNKYEKPQQFRFQISCSETTTINFQLSPRLKRLHKYIFLNAQFEGSECIYASQDVKRILVDEQKWELGLRNICCGGKNATKVFNQTITVTVKDGFKMWGVSIKTKTWNIVIPIITSLLICVFVWFSNFSQPRAKNMSILARFYRERPKKGQITQNKVTIDDVQSEQKDNNQPNSLQKEIKLVKEVKVQNKNENKNQTSETQKIFSKNQ